MLKLIITLELLRRGYTHDDAMHVYQQWSFAQDVQDPTRMVGVTGLVNWLEEYYPDKTKP